MKRGFLAAGSLAASLVLTSCIGGDFGMPFEKTVDETRPLATNGEFSLENTNGTVKLVTWDEPRVRIEAVKHASSERALDDLKVEIAGEGDRLSVRTRYPRPRWMGGGAKVDYRVTVPHGARVRVSTVNGRVEVDGVGAALKASTVNGSVDVTGAGGEVEASAVNGSVDVVVARVDPSGRSELSTTNGSVRLTLPREASADIEAHTVNGSVGCDFDLASVSKSRRKIEGRIGSGGARFELATVNGSAHVDRGLSAASRPEAEATHGTRRPLSRRPYCPSSGQAVQSRQTTRPRRAHESRSPIVSCARRARRNGCQRHSALGAGPHGPRLRQRRLERGS